MKRKYMVHPGSVYSKRDNQLHYITSNQLIKLYAVDPKDCVISPPHFFDPENDDGYIHLFPRNDGNYTNHKRAF